MKKMILPLATFIFATVVLTVSYYAWFTKRAETPGFDQNTDGLRLEYDISDNKEAVIEINDLAFFDYKNESIVSDEYEYLADMSLRYDVVLHNICDYDFYVNVVNKDISSDTPYVFLLVFAENVDFSLYSSFDDLKNASLNDNKFKIEANSDKSVVFYVFGVVPNEPDNNDFLKSSYKLNVCFNVSTNS